MPLETANYIYDFVLTNPPDTDLVQQGDDHLRLIKKVIQQTWPNLTGPNIPTSTGSANAQVVTHVYGPAAYSSGQLVTFKAGFTNTGATTINVNGGGAVTLAIGGNPLPAGALVAGSIYTILYDAALGYFSIISGINAFLPLIGGTLTGPVVITAPSGTAASLGLNQTGQHNWSIINQATSGQLIIFDNTNSASALTFATNDNATFGGQVIAKGTATNDNAAAGNVGEVISSVVTAAVTLTSITTANIASIALTAGDWEVHGEVWFSLGTGAATSIAAGINTTSATMPSAPAMGSSRVTLGATFNPTSTQIMPVSPARISLAASGTAYLVANSNFSSGTTTATGVIWARRIR